MANTIQDKLAYLEETKEAIKQSIIAKGVSVSDEDTFRSYADKIEAIETGGGTGDCNVAACFDDVGYTFVPVYIQEGLKTAAQFKAAWNPENTSIDMTGYEDSTVFFPKIDTSKVTTLKNAFEDTSILVFPNNDFPSLQTNNTFNSTFQNASRLVSIDFGVIPNNTYELNKTFSGCTNLERLKINNAGTTFKLSISTFEGCKSLSEDIEQCNIFDYIDCNEVNLNHTFDNAKLVAHLNIVKPSSLYYSFYQCDINNKNITFTFDNTSDSNYSSYTFGNIYPTDIPTSTLKVTGNLTVRGTNSNLFNLSISASNKPIFDTLDISNFIFTNNISSVSSYDSVNLFYKPPVYHIVGLNSYEENFPNITSYVNVDKLFLFFSIINYNLLKELPEGIETYYNKIKNKLTDVKWGTTRYEVLYRCYNMGGTIDLSFFDGKIVGNNVCSILGSNNYGDITIRLDNADWSDFTASTDNTNFFNSSNIKSLYMQMNFDKITTVNLSKLSNWTDHDSLIWSLLTHSTDRTAQSLGTQTIRLSANSYNALTDDERSQIEAKGYTLTHS